jgi:hypothetical protein
MTPWYEATTEGNHDLVTGRSRHQTWDATTAIEALAAADSALWIWTPAEDSLRFTGATRSLGLGPLAPDCSSAAFIAGSNHRRHSDPLGRIRG